MKRRLLLSSLLIALLAVVALGVPLAWAGSRLVRGEEHRRLDRLADAVGFVASGGSEGRQGPIAAATLTHVAQNERRVEVTDARGRRVAAGPRLAGPILQARITTAQGTAVLVSESAGPIDRQVHLLWLLVAEVGLVALAAAGVFALIQARRLTAPLAALADASARLGEGDFSARARHYGLREVDVVADSLTASGARIAELVAREREFSANASHQLRSPLTALRMRLEELLDLADNPAAKTEAAAALEQAEGLETTVDELLALARRGRVRTTTVVDAAERVHRLADRWQAQFAAAGRELLVKADHAALARLAPWTRRSTSWSTTPSTTGPAGSRSRFGCSGSGRWSMSPTRVRASRTPCWVGCSIDMWAPRAAVGSVSPWLAPWSSRTPDAWSSSRPDRRSSSSTWWPTGMSVRADEVRERLLLAEDEPGLAEMPWPPSAHMPASSGPG